MDDGEDQRSVGRNEVKAAVEEWFSNVSLDDLFAVKNWDVNIDSVDSEKD